MELANSMKIELYVNMHIHFVLYFFKYLNHFKIILTRGKYDTTSFSNLHMIPISFHSNAL